jgi:transposase-like protein
MKRKRHTPQQILEKLRKVEAEQSQGKTITEAARIIEVSEQTLHRWRNQFGGMKGPDVSRLKELERENARLKKIVAEQAMDIDVLKEVSRKTGKPARQAAGGGLCTRGA